MSQHDCPASVMLKPREVFMCACSNHCGLSGTMVTVTFFAAAAQAE
jgi:hypothetical protein